MTRMMRTPDGVAAMIRAAQHIALCSHVHPDGDTLGSALALAHAVRRMGKSADVFCDDSVPHVLQMLPGSEDVRTPDQAAAHYDLLIAIDVADVKRMGMCADLIQRADAVAQIDHHGTNPGYAQENDIDPNASATALLVREVIEALGVPLNRDIAMCLYAAVTTDTGNLSFSNTTKEAFLVMGELIGCNMPMSEMNRVLFRQRTPAQAGLLGCVLDSIEYFDNGRITLTTVTQADMRRCGALGEDAEGVVNFGLDITGVCMTAFLRELEDGGVKVSLRAVAPYTVDGVAQQFGGGGHTQAAGCTLYAPLAEAGRQIVSAMRNAMQQADQKEHA